jgi:hypothetical protein
MMTITVPAVCILNVVQSARRKTQVICGAESQFSENRGRKETKKWTYGSRREEEASWGSFGSDSASKVLDNGVVGGEESAGLDRRKKMSLGKARLEGEKGKRTVRKVSKNCQA